MDGPSPADRARARAADARARRARGRRHRRARCTSPRAPSATTSPPRSARPVRPPGPRRRGSRRSVAGSREAARTDPRPRLCAMSDAERLAGYVAVWWEAVDSFTHLLEKVPAEKWSAPTDLPGWDVHAVAAHTAHLEALLGGRPHEDVEIGDAPHAQGMMGTFTEQGVVVRRDRLPRRPHHRDPRGHHRPPHGPPRRPADRSRGPGARTVRRDRLDHRPPAAQPSAGRVDARAGRTPCRGVAGRDRLPRRRSTARPTSWSRSPTSWASAPRHRPARPPVLERGRPRPVTVAVGDDGRARVQEIDGDPTVGLTMDRAIFLVLSGGRRTAEAGTSRDHRRRRPGEPHHRLDGSHPVTWTTDDIADQSGRTALVTGTEPGRPRLPHRPRAGPSWRPRGARRPQRRQARQRRSRAVRAEVPDAVLEQLVVDLADLASVRSAAEKAHGSWGRSTCSSTTRASWRRRSAAARTASSRRWRPTTSGRSSSPGCCSTAAGGVGRRPRGHRVLADAPRRAVGAGRRPAGRAALPPLAGLRPDQAGQPALHVRARPAGPRQAGLPVKAMAAHPGLAGTHLAANGQVGSTTRRRAPRSSTPPSRRCRSPLPPAPGRP